MFADIDIETAANYIPDIESAIGVELCSRISLQVLSC